MKKNALAVFLAVFFSFFFIFLVCAEALIIGHITDSHIGASRKYPERLMLIINQVAPQVDLIISTGDNTSNGREAQYEDYAEIIDKVDIPWLAVPGNHDKNPHLYEKYIGPLEGAYDSDEYRLIGINTNDINYSALDQHLTADKICVVFGHHPFFFLKEKDRAELRIRFKKYQVLAYICGHAHGEYTGIDDDSGAMIIITRAARIGCYKIIKLNGRKIELIPQCANIIGTWNGKWEGSGRSGRARLKIDTRDGTELFGKISLSRTLWGTVNIPLEGKFSENRCVLTGVFNRRGIDYEIRLEADLFFDKKINEMNGRFSIGNFSGDFIVKNRAPAEEPHW